MRGKCIKNSDLNKITISLGKLRNITIHCPYICHSSFCFPLQEKKKQLKKIYNDNCWFKQANLTLHVCLSQAQLYPFFFVKLRLFQLVQGQRPKHSTSVQKEQFLEKYACISLSRWLWEKLTFHLYVNWISTDKNNECCAL